MKTEPSIEKCLKVIKELTKGTKFTEEQLKQRANWLFLLNRLNFWEEIPILLEIIKYEIKKAKE